MFVVVVEAYRNRLQTAVVGDIKSLYAELCFKVAFKLFQFIFAVYKRGCRACEIEVFNLSAFGDIQTYQLRKTASRSKILRARQNIEHI